MRSTKDVSYLTVQIYALDAVLARYCCIFGYTFSDAGHVDDRAGRKFPSPDLHV